MEGMVEGPPSQEARGGRESLEGRGGQKGAGTSISPVRVRSIISCFHLYLLILAGRNMDVQTYMYVLYMETILFRPIIEERLTYIFGIIYK